MAFHEEEVLSINVTKHPQSAMVLGVICSDGKRMPTHWFKKGLKVGGKEYLSIMQDVVKPWLDENYPRGNYVWQQDSAPAHGAKIVQKWCKGKLASFWPSTMLPPSSPDCSPLANGIWGNVKRKACAKPQCNMNDLKVAVEQEWAAMSNENVI